TGNQFLKDTPGFHAARPGAMEDTATTALPNLKKKAQKSSAKHGGRRNGSGRKKGTPNKLTTDVKAAIMEAFCEARGAGYLRKIAKSHPQVFCALLGKILPPQTQISGEPSNPLPIKRIEMRLTAVP